MFYETDAKDFKYYQQFLIPNLFTEILNEDFHIYIKERIYRKKKIICRTLLQGSN